MTKTTPPRIETTVHADEIADRLALALATSSTEDATQFATAEIPTDESDLFADILAEADTTEDEDKADMDAFFGLPR